MKAPKPMTGTLAPICISRCHESKIASMAKGTITASIANTCPAPRYNSASEQSPCAPLHQPARNGEWPSHCRVNPVPGDHCAPRPSASQRPVLRPAAQSKPATRRVAGLNRSSSPLRPPSLIWWARYLRKGCPIVIGQRQPSSRLARGHDLYPGARRPGRLVVRQVEVERVGPADSLPVAADPRPSAGPPA